MGPIYVCGSFSYNELSFDSREGRDGLDAILGKANGQDVDGN